jgi:ABC-type transporter Mla subunit MlaD
VRALLVLLLTLVLPATACSEAESERNLDEIVAGAQRAYDDLAAAVDEVIDGLDDEARQAVDEARAAAEEARAALEDFAEDPSEETRRALREAEGRVEDARTGLEAVADRVPEGVRDAFDRVVSSLGALAQEIRRALERG